MNLRDVSAHWVALHEALGVGRPIETEAEHDRLLTLVDDLIAYIGGDDESPLWGLVSTVGERIREYEAKAHPWPDASSPAQVLAFLMDQHQLRQSDLPEVGAQSVVSAVLSGRRQLNARQVSGLAKRFGISADALLP